MARRGENIYKRKDGRWEGRYKSGYNECGKAKYRSVYGHSYAEVRSKLAPLKASFPAPHTTCRLTVKELFDEWLSAVKLRVKTSTYANYQMKVERHILPEFGGLRYDLLTVHMLTSFIQKKLDAGLSAKYVSDIVIVFKTMAKYISKVHGFRNILTDITLPKVHRKEKPLLTNIQQMRLYKYLLKHQNPTALCILLSLYTGLRVGEVCGLTWRDIPLLPYIAERLKQYKTELEQYFKDKGLPATDMVFTTKAGNLMDPRDFQRDFKLLLKRNGLREINVHALRHTFATRALESGMNVKTLSKILGHSSVAFTLDTYAHVTEDLKFEEMAAMNNFL